MQCRICFSLTFCVFSMTAIMQGAEPSAPPQRALLVGCTQYPNCDSIRKLNGPANDIPLFTSLLKEKFGFQDSEITSLFAWPEEEDRRPTRANIVKAFEELIATAQKDSQVVILISGHGAQVPVSNVNGTIDLSETDELDEIFLPADVKPWDGEKIPNAIIDNEFEHWLETLTAKGANVWIIFDTCHSGTMTRSVETEEQEFPEEQSRAVRSEDLKIPESRLKEHPRSPVSSETLARIEQQSTTTGGRLVAFSAAQSYEEAPELPRPSDAPRKPAYYYGLFTYTLVKAIRRQQTAVSYRDLGQSILNLYSAERGARGPTPVFEGNLNHPVLKLDDWSGNTDFSVSQTDGKFLIAGGELHGISVDSILSIVTRENAEGNQEKVHGYLKVDSTTPATAIAIACTENGEPISPPTELPDGSRCRIITQAFGNMKIKLALWADPTLPAHLTTDLQTALNQLPEGNRKLFQLESSTDDADWIVELLPAAMAARLYGQTSRSPVAILTPKNQIRAENILIKKGIVEPFKNRLLAVYPLAESMEPSSFSSLAEQLGIDLQKIFTWQNVWRVTNSMNPDNSEGDLEISLKVRRNGQDIVNPAVLYAGENVEIRLENNGTQNWWVSLVFVGSDVSISPWLSGSIKASTKFRPARGQVNGNTTGPEAFVVFATPISSTQLEPEFKFLEQAGLGEAAKSRGSGEKSPASPLGQLLDAARTGKSTRGMSMDSSNEPKVLMRSWVTQPKESLSGKSP